MIFKQNLEWLLFYGYDLKLNDLKCSFSESTVNPIIMNRAVIKMLYFFTGALSLVVNGSNENQQLPARYKYIYSRKGHKQLVHMNFVYTKHSTTHGKTSWRCVQYFSLNRCPATVETIDSMIYTVNHQHNHEDCYEKLSRNNIYEMSVSPK